LTALGILAEIDRKYKDRGVHCVALVSDYYDKKAVKEAIDKAKWSEVGTLIDKSDVYYGKLGVYVHPSFGIADRAGKLLAYEPFSKINYYDRIEAQIRYALREIDKRQLIAILNPPVQAKPDAVNAAQINLNFAKYLLELGKLDQALEQAQRAMKMNDQSAEGYALIGTIYAKQKKCDKAVPQFKKALSIDKKNSDAKKGLKLCK